MKKVLSVLIALTVFATTICGLNCTAQAAVTVSSLKNQYPNGTYWNSGNAYTYTNSPHSHSKCFCTSYMGRAHQCVGFAYQLGYLVSGVDIYSNKWVKYTNTSSVDSLKPRDIVSYRSGGHTIFVYSVNGENVTYADCNSNNNCNIRWGQTITKSQLKSTLYSVLSCPVKWNSSQSQSQVYTVKYNANGGSGAPASQTKKSGATITLSNKIPTRSGYTFSGWATSSTSKTVAYKAGAKYSADKSVTLYAVWNYQKSTKYKTPLYSYTINTGKTLVYDSVNGKAKANKIYDTDLCTIKEIYQNGWCKVTFPLDAGGTDTGYVKLSVFFKNKDATVISKTTKAKITTYRRSNSSTTLGYTGKGDKIYVVSSKVNNKYQIIYELTAGGYKLGWISASDYSKNLK